MKTSRSSLFISSIESPSFFATYLNCFSLKYILIGISEILQEGSSFRPEGSSQALPTAGSVCGGLWGSGRPGDLSGGV